MAAAFAEATRAGVVERGGEVIELRGDEALAVFGSARQALRAAVELQDRYAERREADPGLPLEVGIGVDAGEAVPLEQGYRGAALNLAAQAVLERGPRRRPRERERRPSRAARSRAWSTGTAPAAPEGPRGAGSRARRRVAEGAAPRRRKAEASAAAAGEGGGAPGRVARRSARARSARRRARARARPSSSALAQIDANSAGAIDTGSNRLVDQVRVGSGPGRIASGAGSIWVANVLDNTVSRVDPKTALVRQTIAVDLDPTALAFGQGSLWVACSGTRKLLWINPETYKILSASRSATVRAGWRSARARSG